MVITYRQGTLDDLDSINWLVKNAIIQMNKQGINQWDEMYPVREDFERDINKNHLFVGTVGDEIAVTYTINKEYDEDYKNGQWKAPEKRFSIIHRLSVNSKFQNKGIAKQTLEQIEREAYVLGEQAIRLDVYAENLHALKLYQNCGYHKVGIVKWRKGIFYLMEKYLD